MKLLRLFSDVVTDLQGKKFTFEKVSSEPVSEEILELWKSRNYEPSSTGVALVQFPGSDKIYRYPLYIWSSI